MTKLVPHAPTARARAWSSVSTCWYKTAIVLVLPAHRCGGFWDCGFAANDQLEADQPSIWERLQVMRKQLQSLIAVNRATVHAVRVEIASAKR